MKAEKISELTTNRLSIYLRCLNELSAAGKTTVSSDHLAKEFHLNSAQIRKDLAYFGEFGVRGVGYYVEDLRNHLRKILGLDKEISVCIIGSGRLGTALSEYKGFSDSNFRIVDLFDSDPKKVGKKVGNVFIEDIKNFSEIVKRDNIEVAVIAVPAAYAQEVYETVLKAGIKAVMNFAPVPLKAVEDVKLKTVDLTSCFESLSYFLAGNVEINGTAVKPETKGRRKK
ncbi:MAG: redox-sensing transcriptional repressor Rex [Pyrinomonadaceae bacterium]|nr:redox-sensing transcriptional repressor Rex [Pyrinomonadaceae bacterium]